MCLCVCLCLCVCVVEKIFHLTDLGFFFLLCRHFLIFFHQNIAVSFLLPRCVQIRREMGYKKIKFCDTLVVVQVKNHEFPKKSSFVVNFLSLFVMIFRF